MKFTLEKVFLLIGSIFAAFGQAFFALIIFVVQNFSGTDMADFGDSSIFTDSPYATIYWLLSLVGFALLITVFVLAFFLNKNPKLIASLSIIFTTAAAVVNVPSSTFIPIFLAYGFICAAVLMVFNRLKKAESAPTQSKPEINNGVPYEFQQYTA
ncbi:hypothetical protein [Culicoidibacter larvae]|uniref:DUF4064 domain-containing protein n=1 Tax=Culicoidibacter larvae TaxID=2579976 RepID=A0A5R8QC21_9FIRM|nr:hypothetical protein [Culicoidibacter larvae]TLG73894.1 hypothetical protein FEZ08_07115 [Culicoidibacter larvae]